MPVMAKIKVGPKNAPPLIPLIPQVKDALVRVVVDTHVHLPDMFELTFLDSGGVLAPNLIDIGTSIQINGGAEDSLEAPRLITGEVTSIEAEVRGSVQYAIVRGYEKAHRMQRVRRTYVYRNMKDSDIVQMMMAKYALLPTGTPPLIDTTSGVHESLAQFNQTDWEFLKYRAAENGFDFGVVNGTLYFRKPPNAGDGKLFGIIPLPGGPPTLTGGENLLTFRPRITGSNQVPDAMVRAWDPAQKKAIVGKAKATTKQVKLKYKDQSPELYNKFLLPPRIPDIPIPVLLPGTGASIDWTAKEALPTSVNGDVYAVVDRAITGSGQADALAKGVAEHIASTHAEAEGSCKGNPAVQAGQSIVIKNVPGYFNGSWIVTNSRHVFDSKVNEISYTTHFVVSGRQDRSLLSLASLGAANIGASAPPRIDGVVPGICVDNNDPKKQGRVRIALPWLADNYVSDWCRCLQMGMGQKGGWMLLPEPDDEVLVAFEFGDIRRPYVIGGLSNPKDSKKYPVPKVTMGKVEQRGFMSRDGHKMVWSEDPTPDPTDSVPKQKTGMLIEDKEGKLRINLDMKQPAGKKIEIEVKGPKGGCTFVMDDMGKITLESNDPAGSVTIKGMDITIEASKALNLKAAQTKVEGTATLDLQGGVTNVKGTPIKLN